MKNEVMLTTPEVAARLGVSVRRVQALIHAGRLPSQQFGRDHLINESDLALVADRKPGRPPKPAPLTNGQAVKAKPARKRKKAR